MWDVRHGFKTTKFLKMSQCIITPNDNTGSVHPAMQTTDHAEMYAPNLRA